MPDLIVRYLPRSSYLPIWQAMRSFNDKRHEDTVDEIWLLEHEPVFTQGQAGKSEHIINPHEVPVVHTDRGGQVTYHGPGQLMLYALLDLKRLSLGPRRLVQGMEEIVIKTLQHFSISAHIQEHAPGVYVDQAKICSIGMRIRKNCSYHGIALNVNMDLLPFSYIHPCGHKNMSMTQMRHFIVDISIDAVCDVITSYFCQYFGYNNKL